MPCPTLWSCHRHLPVSPPLLTAADKGGTCTACPDLNECAASVKSPLLALCDHGPQAISCIVLAGNQFWLSPTCPS